MHYPILRGITAALLMAVLSTFGCKKKAATDPDPNPDPASYGGNILMPQLVSGTSFALTAQTGTHNFGNGLNVNTFGYNGSLLGPTLEMHKGTNVTIAVTNNVGAVTTVHWHGMHVPPDMDGGPHTEIANNATFNFEYAILNEASTFWYHAHPHGSTQEHVYKGLSGFLIVRDTTEAALALPRTYGVDDLPLLLQDKRFAAGQLSLTGLGDVMTVNGAMNANREVPAQIVRLRLLNGSVERPYFLGFSDNRTFHVIAGDAGLLAAPVATTRLFISPAERYEILVDFSGDQGSSAQLRSFATEIVTQGIVGGANGGGGPGPLNNANFDVIRFDVVAPTASPIASIPTTLVPRAVPWDEADAAVTRTITFTEGVPGDFRFDNLLWDHHRIDQTVTLDDVEVWVLVNNTPVGHPFHIHDITFFVLDRSGVANDGTATWTSGRAVEAGPRDMIFVNAGETVRFITKFTTYSDPDVPYVYHCHMLTHEDHGMMGNFLVVD